MQWSKKWAAVAVAALAPLSLSGCLILPGEFTSEMTVLQSGEFSFAYKGQIQLIGLANILNSELGNTGAEEFKASCWTDPPSQNIEYSPDDDARATVTTALQRFTMPSVLANVPTFRSRPLAMQAADETAKAAADAAAAIDATAAVLSRAAKPGVTDDAWQMAERECTVEEIATQKQEFDDRQVASKKREEEAKKLAAMMLGGVDPNDPKTITRFAKEVERLAAWHKVEHLGNGVFMIDYSTKGQLADDFAFPVIPRYAVGEPMIHVTRWDNGRLRVEAPAFKTDPQLSAMSLLGAGSLLGMMGGANSADKMPQTMAIKGSFTLTTDARILANNTEDGPEAMGNMEVLRWDIGPASFGPPMALLKLAQ